MTTRNNSITDKDVKNKICSKCLMIKPATKEFFNGKSVTKDGLRADCKLCRNTKRRDSVKRNKAHYSEYGRKWYKENPAKRSPAKNREQYLKSIGETEESLQKKKTSITIFKKKEGLSKKTIAYKDNNIFGLKACTTCGKEKLRTKEYYIERPDSADGLNRRCKQCCTIQSRKGANSKIKATHKHFISLGGYDETRLDPINKESGQVKCAYCGKWINPTNAEARKRMFSINNVGHGENRIYCKGDQCREACPTYKQQFYPKGFKKNSSREVNPLVRQMCMERDKYACQKCGTSGEGVTLHAHHILSYAKNKMLANDIENVITLCKGCHHGVHTQEGCEYHDLRCG